MKKEKRKEKKKARKKEQICTPFDPFSKSLDILNIYVNLVTIGREIEISVYFKKENWNRCADTKISDGFQVPGSNLLLKPGSQFFFLSSELFLNSYKRKSAQKLSKSFCTCNLTTNQTRKNTPMVFNKYEIMVKEISPGGRHPHLLTPLNPSIFREMGAMMVPISCSFSEH